MGNSQQKYTNVIELTEINPITILNLPDEIIRLIFISSKNTALFKTCRQFYNAKSVRDVHLSKYNIPARIYFINRFKWNYNDLDTLWEQVYNDLPGKIKRGDLLVLGHKLPKSLYNTDNYEEIFIFMGKYLLPFDLKTNAETNILSHYIIDDFNLPGVGKILFPYDNRELNQVLEQPLNFRIDHWDTVLKHKIIQKKFGNWPNYYIPIIHNCPKSLMKDIRHSNRINFNIDNYIDELLNMDFYKLVKHYFRALITINYDVKPFDFMRLYVIYILFCDAETLKFCNVCSKLARKILINHPRHIAFKCDIRSKADIIVLVYLDN